jgi:hypothetical protein
MPIKRRVSKRLEPLTEDQLAWLQGRESASEFLMSADALVALWAEHGPDILAAWAEDHPGEPFNAPRGADGKRLSIPPAAVEP